MVYGTAYIEVGENDNFTKNYFDEAYNFAKDKMAATAYTNWFYSFEEHNNVGGVGYFSSELFAQALQADQFLPLEMAGLTQHTRIP